MIQSVTGILPPEALTFCQCHEHILLSKGVSWQRNHALCMEDIQKSIKYAVKTALLPFAGNRNQTNKRRNCYECFTASCRIKAVACH